jgi:hypothetical protein
MQQLVTEIRAAGYTNPIVVDKWNQPWTIIKDQLNNIYQGYHFYFNSWSVSGAMSQMKTALSKGIKIINTEVGADYNEYSSFTTATVDELNTFMAQSASLGVGNTVWMNENLNNLPRYQSLGIDFPTVSASETPSPSASQALSTQFLDGFESKSFSTWNGITTTQGDSVVIANDVPYQGNYHARFYTNGNYRGQENAYLTKNVNLQTANASGYFRFSGTVRKTILPDNGDKLYLIRLSSSTGDIALAGVRRENGVNKWLLQTDGTKTSSAVPITICQYYCVTLHWNATQHTAELYVNGVKILEATTNSNSAATTIINMGIINAYNVQNPLTVYGDNFSISN